MTTGSFAVDISKHRRGQASPRADAVAVEEPLEIRLGYSTPDGRASRSISITMRTPGNDEELAAGFLHSESIIRSAADISSIDVCGPPAPDSGNHNVIRVELGSDVAVDLGRLQRHFYTTSSCGVCGKTSLDALKVVGHEPLRIVSEQFSESMLITLPDKLRSAQRTFEETGGLHAAAAFDRDGNIVVVMEDVGRHNAVDKVIGRLLRDGRLPASDLGIMVSGRASFELMQKTLVAGMPMLVAVSAPSSLAVKLAREFDMTLVGFLRGDTFNIYSGEERLCR
ncbi:MAG: formate dehydrogenase accessory sulfurtransferase FdhD [Gammaproteobacteria bacterium]|nr:formate dehydrogenase accessory sulfurtransferase FdhD [Gammaproteobacteria bacterium]NNC77179.1 formate dehydrogenase accessory sulfurtransferase FdhD [Woeseiaceae bacterium]